MQVAALINLDSPPAKLRLQGRARYNRASGIVADEEFSCGRRASSQTTIPSLPQQGPPDHRASGGQPTYPQSAERLARATPSDGNRRIAVAVKPAIGGHQTPAPTCICRICKQNSARRLGQFDPPVQQFPLRHQQPINRRARNSEVAQVFT